MSQSVIGQILSCMVAALTNATAAQERVFDSLQAALERNETPAIVIHPPDAEDSSAFGDHEDQSHAVIGVDILVRGDPWRLVSDPIACQVHAVLMHDEALRNLVTEIRKTGRKWQAKEADASAGCDSLEYQIIYVSWSSDLTQSTN